MLKRLKSDSGSIEVIAAICLVILIGMMVLAVDGGYLFMTRGKYQNGVEAAALGAAHHICDGNYESVARLIASENGLPHESAYLGDEYGDFSVYADFVADSDTETIFNDVLSDPGGESFVYNNAVMISLNADLPAVFSGIFGRDESAVSVNAVGVARRVGLLSCGDDPETSGILIDHWDYMHADFRNTGVIHSNTDVVFDNDYGYVTLSGDTIVSAGGRVVDCPAGAECSSGADVVYPQTALEEVMEGLRAEADFQGRLIPLDEEHFPGDGRYDDEGNFYDSQGIAYVFGPYDGSHDGAVYYFEGTKRLGIKTPGGAHARHLTIASESNLVFTTVVGGTGNYLHLGGSGEDMAYVFTTGNVGGDRGPYLPNYWGAIGDYSFDGVYFRVGGLFGMRPSDGQNCSYVHKLRIIAEGVINIEAASVPPFTWDFSADFGPPCPPIRVKLGNLAPAHS